ncbi:hypothetical protein A2U01_0031550, partial [Trifolium medium]|nr:hypothetical protein [Trifolium medium]
MQIFTGGIKMQHRILLDASAGGAIKMKTYEEIEFELLKKKLSEKASLEAKANQ